MSGNSDWQRITVRLSAEMTGRLDHFIEEQREEAPEWSRLTRAVVIRQAVREFLKKREQTK